MKKALLTSLFCAALVVSAMNFTNPNNSQVDGTSVAAPKLKKQNLYADASQSLKEAVQSSVSEMAIASELTAGSQINGSMWEYEGTIHKPDIITGPIFDPNPGSGGGGGTSTKPSLTTYPEEKDNDYIFDDYACTAQILKDDRGILTGTLEYKDYIPSNYCGGRLGIDKDFFRFSIHEERVYTFNLQYAPGANYYYEIYRFTTDIADNDPYQDAVHQLLYSSRYSDRERTMTLRAGTYFICVTSATKNGLRPELEYKLVFDYEKPDDYYDDVRLNSSYLANYDVITWESEYAPFGFNHFAEEPHTLTAMRNSDGSPSDLNFYGGYVDPIFNKYESEWTAPAYTIYLDEDYKLDSITYLLDQSTIEEFAEKLNEIREEFSRKAKNKLLQSLEVHVDWVDVALGVAGIVLSVAGMVCSAGAATPLAIASIGVSCVGIAKALITAVSFDGDKTHPVPESDISANMTTLYDRCCDIAEGSVTNKIIAIPRYSFLYKERVLTNDTQYIYGTDLCKMSTTPYLPGLYSREYFLFPKNGLIRTVQPMYVPDTKSYDYTNTFKGKIHFFESYDDFKDYSLYGNQEPDFTEGALNTKCSYVINKYGSDYYLGVSNWSGATVFVEYNNCSVSDWQGQNFNFYNKDAYWSHYVSHSEFKTIGLGNRTSVYVREDNSPFITKISYTTNGSAKCEPIVFGTEYLKLAVVTSSWAWFVRTWTIRVRNMFNTPITFWYNKKMCFTGDAEKWSGLKDWKNTATTIQPHESVDIKISENGTADAIGISWVEETSNTRYISYANQLNYVSNTLSYRTSAIGI